MAGRQTDPVRRKTGQTGHPLPLQTLRPEQGICHLSASVGISIAPGRFKPYAVLFILPWNISISGVVAPDPQGASQDN